MFTVINFSATCSAKGVRFLSCALPFAAMLTFCVWSEDGANVVMSNSVFSGSSSSSSSCSCRCGNCGSIKHQDYWL